MMIPWVIPTVIAGLLWAWIYANPYGLLQYLVSIFSGGKITGFGILNNQSTALWGIIMQLYGANTINGITAFVRNAEHTG